jgi:hypothetical protein
VESGEKQCLIRPVAAKEVATKPPAKRQQAAKKHKHSAATASSAQPQRK